MHEFGGLDVLVDNAGVYSFGALESVTEPEFHRPYNPNVLGTLLAVRGGGEARSPRNCLALPFSLELIRVAA